MPDFQSTRVQRRDCPRKCLRSNHSKEHNRRRNYKLGFSNVKPIFAIEISCNAFYIIMLALRDFDFFGDGFQNVAILWVKEGASKLGCRRCSIYNVLPPVLAEVSPLK